jgi:hypothetical protein
MIKLFFSYAHEDEAMRDQLEIHLAMLKRNGLISSWHDRRIAAGSELHQAIDHNLEEADVILLLLSPHFLASNYCYEREAARALERHREGTAIVIPVILQPCDWLHSPFTRLRATPRDGKPVVKHPNVNDAFLEVVGDIRAAAESLHKSDTKPPTAAAALSDHPTGTRSSNLRLKRTFSDRERDTFVDETYSYIAKYFESSLVELRTRNSATDILFKRLSESGFTAAIYVGGSKRVSCHIWLGGRHSFAGDIAYAASDSPATNSVNDGLRVEDDGFQLGMRTNGFANMRTSRDALLTRQGAAEYFWSAFIAPLQ